MLTQEFLGRPTAEACGFVGSFTYCNARGKRRKTARNSLYGVGTAGKTDLTAYYLSSIAALLSHFWSLGFKWQSSRASPQTY
jgi:hypothetical protein